MVEVPAVGLNHGRRRTGQHGDDSDGHTTGNHLRYCSVPQRVEHHITRQVRCRDRNTNGLFPRVFFSGNTVCPLYQRGVSDTILTLRLEELDSRRG